MYPELSVLSCHTGVGRGGVSGVDSQRLMYMAICSYAYIRVRSSRWLRFATCTRRFGDFFGWNDS
jgi:hypothetical protein